MRIFNLIKSAYKIQQNGENNKFADITIILRFRSYPHIAWLNGNPHDDLPIIHYCLSNNCRTRVLIKVSLIAFLRFIKNYYPLPICETPVMPVSKFPL